MSHVTPPRAAFAAALAALLAGLAGTSPLISFYLTAVAAAALIGAGFMAYLRAVESPSPRSLLALAGSSLPAVLVMADAAIRFPQVLTASPPGGPGLLVQGAVVVAGLSLLTELPPLPARVPRPDRAHLRELLSR
jgi:hypothetical protein